MKLARSALAIAVLLTLGACNPAEPQPGPQGDSHTNWLRTCSSDADCGKLSCICGMCTRRCSDQAGCVNMEASCFAASDSGAVAACSGAAPSSGMCLPACEAGGCGAGYSCMAGACVPDPPGSVQIQVDGSTQLQTLAGFGATVGYAEDELTAMSDRSALDDAMFAGLGLDVMRVRNRYGEVSNTRLAQAQTLVDAATRSLGRRPLVLLSAWSAPANLKQNGSTFCAEGPANCTLSKTASGEFDYAGFAQYWRDSLTAYAEVGFVPDYVGIQNNADWAPAAGLNFEACKFLPTEGSETVLAEGTQKLVAYPGYAEALTAVMTAIADLPARPKLLAPELMGVRGAQRYFAELDASRIDAIAHHMYGSVASQPDLTSLSELGDLHSSTALPLFQTEMEAGGFDTALLIHHTLVTEGAAMYLQTVLVGARSGPAASPSALIGLEDGDFVLQTPYFAMQHYARFTDPGYQRLAATASDPSILVSAWRAPLGSATSVVLTNAGTTQKAVRIGLNDNRSFELFRTVFDGGERMTDLGTFASGSNIVLPPRSMATARFE